MLHGCTTRVLVSILSVTMLAAPAMAQPPQQIDPKKAADDLKKAAESEANKSFLGIDFGLGLGMAIDISPGDRVDEASVVAGVVRVNKTSNARPRVLLETHYFWQARFETREVQFGGQRVTIEPAKIGMGPFLAIQGSDEQVLEAIGMGLMVGFRRGESSSLNFGVGAVLDPDVQTLGDGIEANKSLPSGETEIRYKKEGRWGILALASFSF